MPNVIVINPFEVPPGKEDNALAAWELFADFFRNQPGYVSTKLHRAVSPDARFHLINVAEWESAEHFLAAINSEDLQKLSEGLVETFPHYPGIYEVIRT